MDELPTQFAFPSWNFNEKFPMTYILLILYIDALIYFINVLRFNIWQQQLSKHKNMAFANWVTRLMVL